jgi:hypothetical protein
MYVHVSYSESFFEIELFHSTVVCIWRPVLSFPPACESVDSDIVGVLCEMSHILTNAEYVDMLYAVVTRVAKCTDVDGGILENVVY